MFLRQIILVFCSVYTIWYGIMFFFFPTSKKTIVFYLMEVNILFKNILMGDFYWIFVLVVC